MNVYSNVSGYIQGDYGKDYGGLDLIVFDHCEKNIFNVCKLVNEYKKLRKTLVPGIVTEIFLQTSNNYCYSIHHF